VKKKFKNILGPKLQKKLKIFLVQKYFKKNLKIFFSKIFENFFKNFSNKRTFPSGDMSVHGLRMPVWLVRLQWPVCIKPMLLACFLGRSGHCLLF
jgi:hypothetical protein